MNHSVCLVYLPACVRFNSHFPGAPDFARREPLGKTAHIFHRPCALHVISATVSKHWRKCKVV